MKPNVTEFPCYNEEHYTFEFNINKQNQGESDESDANVYIIFDFECTLDQVLECSKGPLKSSIYKKCVNSKLRKLIWLLFEEKKLYFLQLIA